MDNKGKYRVLAISDLQAPFQHRDTLDFLDWVKRKYKPDTVVCVGDEVDHHAISDYDSDPDGYSAGEELNKALVFMHDLYSMFPDVMACTSNHTDRPFRKAFAAGIPRRYLKEYHEFLEAPKGWEWRYQWEVDGVTYEHGEGFSGQKAALNCAMKNDTPTVIGHVHSHAGILYEANAKRLLYGFNVGCLIDVHAYAFRYGKNLRNKPILGVGIIDKGIPKYIPMLLDSKGRWLKK